MATTLADINRPLIRVIGHNPIVAIRDSPLYVNLDNAATTPAAVAVAEAVNELLPIYGSVQRGAGLKSLISTELYYGALAQLKSFVAADSEDVVVTATNTTTAINRLASTYGFSTGDIVLISDTEHSSNDLPWRRFATVFPIRSTKRGELDLRDLTRLLRSYGRSVRLVALTGASNVSGYLPPLQEAASLAHKAGAEVFVDCAQLIAHRRVQMRTVTSLSDFDYVAFSGHKMYAPFGAGVLIGRRKPFEHSTPDLPGGGTVDMITRDKVIWASLPSKLVPGTPNVVGLVAMAVAAKELSSLNPEDVRRHEQNLVQHGRSVLRSISGVTLYGHDDIGPTADQLPIFPFTVAGYHHSLVAAVLAHEYGIAVRAGHLCQYEFMRRRLNISDSEQSRQETLIRARDKSSLYGMVRASCGLCNTVGDLNALADALRSLISRRPQLEYQQDRTSGQFTAVGQDAVIRRLAPESLKLLLNII